MITLSSILIVGSDDVFGQTVPTSYDISEFASGFLQLQGIAVNPVNGNIYILENNGSTVYVRTPNNTPVLEFDLSWPDSIGFSANGEAFIGRSGSGSFSFNEPGIINKIDTDNVVSTFSDLFSDIDGIDVDSLGNVYGARGRTSQGVLMFNPMGTAIDFFSTSSICTNPDDIVIDNNDNLYVGCGGVGGVSKITPSGVVSLFADFPVTTPFALAIDPDDNLYIATFEGDIGIYNKNTGILIQNFGSGFNEISGMAFDEEGSLFVNQWDGKIYKISINPANAVDNIIAFIESLGLPPGEENSLIGPLNGFNSNNPSSCSTLNTFINVNVPNSSLSQTQKDQLIQEVNAVQNALGC